MTDKEALAIAIEVMRAAGRGDVAHKLSMLLPQLARLEQKEYRFNEILHPTTPLKNGTVFASVYVHEKGTIPYARPVQGDELIEALQRLDSDSDKHQED